MKKIIFILFICFSQIIFGQSADQKLVQKDAQSFVSFFESKNVDAILDMTHPAVFSKIDRPTLKKTFDQLLNGNEDFKIELGNLDNSKLSVSNIFTDAQKTKYAFVSYPMTMKMIFLKQKFDNSQKEMMSKGMEAQGFKVKFLNDQTIQMDKLSMIVAVNDNTTKNSWKYINYDETNPIFISVLSPEIMKKAKEQYSDLLIKEKENAN